MAFLPFLVLAVPVAQPDEYDVVVTVVQTVYVSDVGDTPAAATEAYVAPTSSAAAAVAATTSSFSSNEQTTMVYADATTTYDIGIMDATTTSYYDSAAATTTTAAAITAAAFESTAATTFSTSTSSSSTVSSASSSNTAIPSTIRGINVGGWLVLEQWLGGDDFWAQAPDASDEYSFCSALGSGASDALQAHWASWFTQDTVNQLASYGLNALRIPIGYWSFLDDGAASPYVAGAADYLDQAIGWASAAGMKVWVDLHGAPGSQNGFDNSGHAGSVEWQTGDNVDATISVLKTIAAKYSGSAYADTVIAIELINEPISWDGNNVDVTRQFYKNAYAAVRDALTDNTDLMVIIHDAFMDLSYWSNLPSALGASGTQIGIDTHRYQVFDDSQVGLDGAGHLSNVCSQADDIAASDSVMPTYVGEWSAAVDVCFFSNGSSAAGSSCSEDGCSCVSDDQSSWSSAVSTFVRQFVEAQMDVFEGKGSGYFFWSHVGPGNWNFVNGVEQGWIPQPLTDRSYPSQCGFTLSDMTSSSSTKMKRALNAHLRRRRRRSSENSHFATAHNAIRFAS